ncbi:DUF1080 domain-containing protein [uncultured Gimesia sp.]|jgi:hypothetical protein|uniref:3-keto-disaccharide hydrolase n=1 Tax=uncultured Gimesia sp. TaxID=1678688 RepID=UPI00261A67AC|nr:DUF1080 domain-containing protein [uncultured Gimesia sp.]
MLQFTTRKFTALCLLAFASFSVVPLSAEEHCDSDFVSIFNGKNLDGWKGATDGYFAEDGMLISKKDSGGNLFTDKEYKNFVLRFDFKLEPGANNGIGFHVPMDLNKNSPAYAGKEIQILDDSAEKYAKLQKYQYHGSLYGTAAAERGHLKPVGEWNTQELLVDGNKVKVTLNGTTILDFDMTDAKKNGTMDGKDHPGLKRESGHLCLCGHGAKIEFKNMRIKELK